MRRVDAPGTWWHVMNRAVGRRAMFESDRDVARFLRRLDGAVEQGWIEVHVFVVMQTHFHLFLLSLTGEISRAIHFVEAPYGQWFNRSRGRDGPLHRGRFLAKRVGSEVYQRRLVSYIDANPVTAGLAPTPAAYPHGSARLFERTRSPEWHARWWVEEQVRLRTGQRDYDPRHYRVAFPPIGVTAEDDPITLGSGERSTEVGPVDFLLESTDETRFAWLQELAQRADGTAVLRPVVAASAVRDAIMNTKLTAAPVGLRKGKATERSAATALLLRSLAGSTLADVAIALDCSVTTAARISRTGARLLTENGDFAVEVTRAIRAALDQTYGRWRY